MNNKTITYEAVFTLKKSGFTIRSHFPHKIEYTYDPKIQYDSRTENFSQCKGDNLENLIIVCKNIVKKALEREIDQINVEQQKIKILNEHIDKIDDDIQSRTSLHLSVDIL